MPTEEFPIRSSLQLMIEFVAAIGEDEEMVVHEWDVLGSFPCQSVGWVRGGHVSIGLINKLLPPSIPLCVESVIGSSFPSSTG